MSWRTCEQCGKETFRVERLQHEHFGSQVYEEFGECLNPKCEEDTEDE